MRDATALKRPGISGFFHGGVTVSDLDRALDFYVGALGLEIETQRTAPDQYLRDMHGLPFTAVRIAFLRVANSNTMVELLEFQGMTTTAVRAVLPDPGVGHLCFYVDDLDGLHARLKRAGYHCRSEAPVEITAGPNRGSRVIFVNDPDGFPIELLQRPA